MADISSDNFSPDKYIEVIGSIAATRCQNDISPQLPASVCVAQAIKECGFDPNTIFFKQSDGKINYNIFNVVGPNSSGSRFTYCSNFEEAVDLYYRNMHESGYYDNAISFLKPKITDSTTEDKMNYLQTLIPIYAPSSENNVPKYIEDVINHINTYDLFKYDNPELAGQKIDEAWISKMALAAGSGSLSGTGLSSDSGFKRISHGKMVTIIKLPENKTFAEPIYPDLITVSDTVPQWIIDVAVQKQNTEIEDNNKQEKNNESNDKTTDTKK